MPKMLELFGSVLPKPTTVAVLVDSSSAVHPRMWRTLGPIAQRLNIQLVKVEAGREPAYASLPVAFDAAVRQRATGIFVLPDEPFFIARRREIVALAAQHRLPALYGLREYVDEGGLMSYGESLSAAFRSLATYIDKIATGIKPGEIPVSQPTQFELVINLKTARALGIPISQAVLLSADEVIQ
jgi:putative ABC transport system substrate-binding protein